MTLRLRLAIALVALVTVGLAVFGYTTYTLYSRSQYDRLDDSLRGSVGLVGSGINGGPDGDADHEGGPPRSGPLADRASPRGRR